LRKKFAIRQQKGKQQQQQQQQQQPSSATLGFYLLSHQTKNGKTHSQNPSNCNNNNNKTKPTHLCVILGVYIDTYLPIYLPTYLPTHSCHEVLVDIYLC
jgi:type IV secretory pathway VirB6-like protein